MKTELKKSKVDVQGKNAGKLEVVGEEMIFKFGSKRIFDVTLTDVSNAQVHTLLKSLHHVFLRPALRVLPARGVRSRGTPKICLFGRFRPRRTSLCCSSRNQMS